MMKKSASPFRSWRDFEDKIRNTVIRVVTKLADSGGNALVYQGMYLGKIGRYIFLSNVKIYKYNVFKNEEQEIKQLRFVVVKEDIVGSIELPDGLLVGL